MQVMVILIMVVAVLSIGWFVHARQEQAGKVRARKTQAAQKLRLARGQPAEEGGGQKKPRDPRPTFGNR